MIVLMFTIWDRCKGKPTLQGWIVTGPLVSVCSHKIIYHINKISFPPLWKGDNKRLRSRQQCVVCPRAWRHILCTPMSGECHPLTYIDLTPTDLHTCPQAFVEIPHRKVGVVPGQLAQPHEPSPLGCCLKRLGVTHYNGERLVCGVVYIVTPSVRFISSWPIYIVTESLSFDFFF